VPICGSLASLPPQHTLHSSSPPFSPLQPFATTTACIIYHKAKKAEFERGAAVGRHQRKMGHSSYECSTQEPVWALHFGQADET